MQARRGNPICEVRQSIRRRAARPPPAVRPDDRHASLCQHAMDLASSTNVAPGREVLDHVKAGNQIESPILERKRERRAANERAIVSTPRVAERRGAGIEADDLGEPRRDRRADARSCCCRRSQRQRRPDVASTGQKHVAQPSTTTMRQRPSDHQCRLSTSRRAVQSTKGRRSSALRRSTVGSDSRAVSDPADASRGLPGQSIETVQPATTTTGSRHALRQRRTPRTVPGSP